MAVSGRSQSAIAKIMAEREQHKIRFLRMVKYENIENTRQPV
jgi:hypothetical protein